MAQSSTKTPITRAPAHNFDYPGGRRYRLEVKQEIQRCAYCQHFIGNHTPYVFNERCNINGCECNIR